MTTTRRRRHPSPHARFPSEPAAFDVPCALEEALRRLHTVVRRSALSRWSEPGLVGRASREAVRVRWYSGSRAYLPVVFDGHFTERPDGVVLAGHYRHARRTKLVCNFVLGLCVLVLVFGIMGMTVLWTIGTGAAADRWLASVILLGLIGISALALLKGKLPLRAQDCDELSGAIRTALQIAPAR
jgi:hypothetical protein